MSNELQGPNPFVSISLWDNEICYDKMFVSLVGLSKFLEQCAKKSATDFLNIGIHKENGWINSGADYLEAEMRRACNQINYYITRNNILNAPNWNMFLEPWVALADNSKQLTLSLHKSLVDSCRKEVSEQAHQAYLNSMANSEGLGFGIVSNSLTAHLVYAVQSAAKDAENKRKAQAAADSVRLANSPVTKANELFAKAYHETHEPFVLSCLTDFYSSVESFIYKGVGYDKEKIDTQIQKSISILKNNTIDVRQRVLMALCENICCGEAILSAIKNDIADNDFIDFCNHAPIILLKNSIDPIIEWLKTEKHTNQLYNRPIFSKNTLHFLSTTQRILLSDGQKAGFYDEIVNGAFSEEISNTYSEFYDLFHIDSVIEKYANNGIHISINNKTINQLAILCNDVRCRKLINYCKAANFSSPIESEQITTLITHTNATIDKRHSNIVAEQIRIARIEAEAKAEKERIEAEQRKKRQAELAEQRAKAQAEQEAKHALALKREKKTISVLTPIIIFALVFAFWLWPDVIQPRLAYDKAQTLLADKQYDASINAFASLGNYKNSAEMVDEAKYQKALYLSNTGSLSESIDLLESLDGYAESAAELEKIQYAYANELFEQGKYDDAKAIYQNISTYENSTELMLECDYQKATHYYETEVYDRAIEVFQSILEYKDSEDMIVECKYCLAKGYLAAYQYNSAKSLLEELGKYKDASKYLELLSQVKSLAYQSNDHYSYYYMWVYTIIDVDACSLKVMAKTAGTRDRVGNSYIQYEQEYIITSTQTYEEWRYDEDGKLLMFFEGTDPTEDQYSYRAWTISNDWSSISVQSMKTNGEILGDPGEYLQHYKRIKDEEIAKKVIDNIQHYMDW